MRLPHCVWLPHCVGILTKWYHLQYDICSEVMSKYTNKNYFNDNIKALDARHEAQKIAFAPLTFQAVRGLLDLGLLQIISEAKENGISLSEVAAAA